MAGLRREVWRLRAGRRIVRPKAREAYKGRVNGRRPRWRRWKVRAGSRREGCRGRSARRWRRPETIRRFLIRPGAFVCRERFEHASLRNPGFDARHLGRKRRCRERGCRPAWSPGRVWESWTYLYFSALGGGYGGAAGTSSLSVNWPLGQGESTT